MPGIFGVITPFVARFLGGVRSWRRRGSLGGPCVAFGRGGSDLGRPRTTRGGPGSVFGFGGVRPVTRRTNIAASQTPAAGTVLLFTNGAPGPFCDRSATRPRRGGLPVLRRANRHHRLLLGRHDDEEASNYLLKPILTTAPPTWRTKDVGGNDTYGITRIPTTVAGHGVMSRADQTDSKRFVYPGLGRGDA